MEAHPCDDMAVVAGSLSRPRKIARIDAAIKEPQPHRCGLVGNGVRAGHEIQMTVSIKELRLHRGVPC